MKRVLIGVVVGFLCCFAGIAAARVAWPSLPAITVAEEPQFEQVGLCELTRDPGRYDGKLVRVTARYGWVNPTILGYLHTRECGKLVRAVCPTDPSGCRQLLSLQGGDAANRGDVDIVGRFRADDRTPLGDQHRIEVWRVMNANPLAGGFGCSQ